MLHIDRVQSKKCSETEPNWCWTERSRAKIWTCTNTNGKWKWQL